MKSRKIFLIAFLGIVSAIGLTTMQDSIFVENQVIDVSETSSKVNQVAEVDDASSEVNTITVSISDGIGSGDAG